MRTFATASIPFVAFLLLASGGCKKSTSADAPSTGSAATADPAKPATPAAPAGLTPPDPAKVGKACKEDGDCGFPDYQSDCQFDCMKKDFDAPEGFCQLQTLATTVGATPCTAQHLGTTTIGGGWTDTKYTYTYACDVNAGVYCDGASNACAAVKGVGADCNPSDRNSEHDGVCGKDGVCDEASKKCIAATAVGASCKDEGCASNAYCDSDTKLCVARKADGDACNVSDQCASYSCSGTTCNAAKPATPCAL